MKKNIIPGVPNQKGSVWRMQQKFFHWAMVMAVAAAVACTGCSQNRTTGSGTAESAVTQVTESAEDQTETSGISGQALSSVQSGTMGVTTDTEDETDTYDSFDAEITLKDEDTKVKGNTKAVTVDGNQVTITAGGTYSITGSLTDGQLLVTGSEKVKLYCNGMQIANSSGPALVCLNEKRTILSLAKDTENRLEDGSGYSEEEISGKNVSPSALYVQDKLTINGTGSLTINGNCADGIVCKDVLKLMDGTITDAKTVATTLKVKVLLAQALFGKPDIILLDEPTNGLDPAGIQEMRELICSLPERFGMTVVVSSHLLSEIDQMADHVAVIREGELVFQNTLEALHGRSRHHLALQTTNNAVAHTILQESSVPCQEEDGYLILPILSDEIAAQLTRLLAQRRLGVIRLEERQKSLEDIFLELTGKAASL